MIISLQLCNFHAIRNTGFRMQKAPRVAVNTGSVLITTSNVNGKDEGAILRLDTLQVITNLGIGAFSPTVKKYNFAVVIYKKNAAVISECVTVTQ